MDKLRSSIFILLSISIIFSLSNCGPDPIEEDPVGNLKFMFEHYSGSTPVAFDDMTYTNPAGNNYEVSEIQWIISDITLRKLGGENVILDAWTFYHYIDSDIPSTREWQLEDKIHIGEYESITFTFGLKGDRNEPYMFVNWPESAMFWPIHLGGDEGGYHYLKLNGFWNDVNNFRRGYQFHLGVGQKQYSNGTRMQVWDSDNNDSSYVFVQNWFDVTLDNSAITIEENETTTVTIRMDVEEWFQNPNNYDFDYFGGETMENQEALNTIKENGTNVFSVSKIE